MEIKPKIKAVDKSNFKKYNLKNGKQIRRFYENYIVRFVFTLALIAVTMTVLVFTFVRVLRQTLKEKKKIEEDMKARKSLNDGDKADDEGFVPVFDVKNSETKDKKQP